MTLYQSIFDLSPMCERSSLPLVIKGDLKNILQLKVALSGQQFIYYCQHSVYRREGICCYQKQIIVVDVGASASTYSVCVRSVTL